MEVNYSNYDRSQIKLKLKAPNQPQREFFFLTYLFPKKERKERRTGCEAV